MLRLYWTVLRESITKFFGEDLLSQSAALAFYIIFCLPSMLFIILWISSQFHREIAVREAIFTEVGALVGEEGAQQLIATLKTINIQEPTWWGTAIGIGILMFTATTVLVTLHNTLNRIFEISPTKVAGLNIWRILWGRVVSFTLVVTIAFILLLSLVVDAMITAFGVVMVERVGRAARIMIAFDSFFIELAGTTVLFALFFRYLPDVKLNWKDTWNGASMTAGLFTTGKYLIGFIIGNSIAANLYDAAGSVMVLMLWFYYASAIFLFGATFTYTRAQRINHG